MNAALLLALLALSACTTFDDATVAEPPAGEGGASGSGAGQGGGAGKAGAAGQGGAGGRAGAAGAQAGAAGAAAGKAGAAGSTGGQGGSAGKDGASGAGQGGATGGGASGQGGQAGQTTCTTVAQCDDQNPCTDQSCEKGVCVFVTDDTLALPQDSPTDCVRRVCQGGQVVSVPDDLEIPPADFNECDQEVCKAGSVAKTPTSDGSPCSLSGIAGLCQGGACQINCSSNSHCDDQNPCTTDVCSQGACTHDPGDLEGKPAPGTLDSPGDCRRSICLGGQVSEVENAADVPALTECQQSVVCQAASPVVTPRADGTACTSGGVLCKAGVCAPAQCGDGFLSSGEECDGELPGSVNCSTYLPGTTGQPTCQQCKIDLSGCAAPSCLDGAKNQNETDLDCGGANSCLRCAQERSCLSPGDCLSAACLPDLTMEGSMRCGPASGCQSSVKCSGKQACIGERCLSPEDTLAPDTKPGQCPDSSWFELGGRCYKGFDEVTSWYGAFMSCRALGASLATFGGVSDLDLLTIMKSAAVNINDTNKYYWIGMSCGNGLFSCDAKSEWRWMDTGQVVQDLWGAESPSSRTGSCGVLRFRQLMQLPGVSRVKCNGQAQLSTAPDTSLQGYVCEQAK